MEPGSLTPGRLFTSRLDTLIRCPPKYKRAPDDTLYLSSRGAGSTLTLHQAFGDASDVSAIIGNDCVLPEPFLISDASLAD